MSTFLARLIQTTAKTANAAAHGVAHKRAIQGAGGKRKDDKPGCTPCEAMARREAARRIVNGNG
jgi:hypothetical protein